MPSYSMSTFLLPKGWCTDLDRSFKNFFWGFSSNHKGFTPFAWSSICQPKELGGLGLRRMADINRALISKLGWFMYTRPEALWVKALKATSTWIWQGIWATRDILRKGLLYIIRDGASVNIWTDPWVPGMPYFEAFPHSQIVQLDVFSKFKTS